MKISTRGRYAVRVMLDLAQQDTSEYTPLMDIARRQEISEKYLESIVSMLVKNDFLAALRGKGGGYKLIRRPEEYTVGSILKITEGSLHRLPVLNTARTSVHGLPIAKPCLCGKDSRNLQKIISTESPYRIW